MLFDWSENKLRTAVKWNTLSQNVQKTLMKIETEIKTKVESSNSAIFDNINAIGSSINITQKAVGELTSGVAQYYEKIAESNLTSKEKIEAGNAVASGLPSIGVGVDKKYNNTEIESGLERYLENEIDLQQFVEIVMDANAHNNFRVGNFNASQSKFVIKQFAESNNTSNVNHTTTTKDDHTENITTNTNIKQKQSTSMSITIVIIAIIGILIIGLILYFVLKK